MTGGSGSGHPLPASDEARHDEVPETLAEEKGTGGDDSKRVTPHPEAVDPSGDPYPANPDA